MGSLIHGHLRIAYHQHHDRHRFSHPCLGILATLKCIALLRCCFFFVSVAPLHHLLASGVLGVWHRRSPRSASLRKDGQRASSGIAAPPCLPWRAAGAKPPCREHVQLLGRSLGVTLGSLVPRSLCACIPATLFAFTIVINTTHIIDLLVHSCLFNHRFLHHHHSNLLLEYGSGCWGHGVECQTNVTDAWRPGARSQL